MRAPVCQRVSMRKCMGGRSSTSRSSSRTSGRSKYGGRPVSARSLRWLRRWRQSISMRGAGAGRGLGGGRSKCSCWLGYGSALVVGVVVMLFGANYDNRSWWYYTTLHGKGVILSSGARLEWGVMWCRLAVILRVRGRWAVVDRRA